MEQNPKKYELNEYHRSLIKYLKDYFPEFWHRKDIDVEEEIIARGNYALSVEKSQEEAGYPNPCAREFANEALYAGFHFSYFQTIQEVLEDDFFEELKNDSFPKEMRPFVHKYYENPEYDLNHTGIFLVKQRLIRDIFDNYNINDEFDGTCEYDQLKKDLSIRIKDYLQYKFYYPRERSKYIELRCILDTSMDLSDDEKQFFKCTYNGFDLESVIFDFLQHKELQEYFDSYQLDEYDNFIDLENYDDFIKGLDEIIQKHLDDKEYWRKKELSFYNEIERIKKEKREEDRRAMEEIEAELRAEHPEWYENYEDDEDYEEEEYEEPREYISREEWLEIMGRTS